MNDAKLARKIVPILYEDEHVVAVDKPAGVDVGGLDPGGAPGLVEALAQLPSAPAMLSPANRLSRYESGVLVLGKNEAIVRHIRNGLKMGSVNQEYIAVARGHERQRVVTVGAREGSSRGRRTKSRSAVKSVTATPNSSTRVFTLRAGESRSLIRCETTAPTTHALRAQLRAIHLRLLGDVYRDPGKHQVPQSRTCLHLQRFAFHHPGLKRKLVIRAARPERFEAVVNGDVDQSRPLRAALARRLAIVSGPDAEACRLLTGDAEDIPGLIVERYGPMALFQVVRERPALRETLSDIARWYRDQLGIETAHVKWNVRQPGRDAATTDGGRERPLFGPPAPDVFEIGERGLRFLIRPHEGLSVGLFLDQRDNRTRIREVSRGKDVLNLFAYTCGFSLAAAKGGAASTVSVDLSPRHIEWGVANFEANGVPLARHSFVQADAMGYLADASREGREFDMVVLDPPSFAHGRKRMQDFSIVRDLTELVTAAAKVLRRDGMMMVSTNMRRFPRTAFRERVKAGLRARRGRIVGEPPLPPDFAIDPDHSRTIFARVE